MFNLIVRHNESNQVTYTYERIVTLTAFLAKTVPISALALFCSVGWLSSSFYESIQQDIDQIRRVRSEHIHMWKKKLNLAGELVNQINRCFGLILLISITHFFVDLIPHVFYIVNSISTTTQTQMAMGLFNVMRKLLFLWAVTYIPAKIHFNVIVLCTC